MMTRSVWIKVAQSDRLKRVFDLACCSVGLLFAGPVMGVIAVALKASSPFDPVFYRGIRVGRYGKPFTQYKFRSMVVNAEKLGGSATANDDSRITRQGRFLRKYKLDELPQLFNVLKGDMSMVGPRPEVQKFVDLYTAEEARILELKPGITDWASIWDSDEGSILAGCEDPEKLYEQLIRPTKLRLQLRYHDTRTITTDARILAHTLLKLLNKRWTPTQIASYCPPDPHARDTAGHVTAS